MMRHAKIPFDTLERNQTGRNNRKFWEFLRKILWNTLIIKKKLRKIIANLTSEKALKISLDKREYYRLKKKLKSNEHTGFRKNTFEKLSGF